MISFAKNFNLTQDIFVDENLYLTEGGEAKIYLAKDGTHVIKVNDVEMGIRFEDVHDENVIKQNGIYFFIDTVFYIDIANRKVE